MCLNPTTIFNRSIYVNRTSGSILMQVPCCKCSECYSLKRDEWTLRAFYEWKECMKHNGIGLFDTLTYNPYSLDTRTFYGIPTFNKMDLRLFFHKLRNRLNKSGIKFRYLVTCEYGELMHRPHYHVLFFIYPPTNKRIEKYSLALRFHAAISASWTEPKKLSDGSIAYRLINGRKSIIMRSLGFHDLRKECLNHIIDRVDGIRYVTKYITKDDEYYSYLGNLKQCILNRMTDENAINEVNQAYEMGKPFHLQSLGFGKSALSEIKDILDNDPNSDVISNIAISNAPIKIPMYYLRKIFYTLEKTGIKPDGKPYYSWKLTEVGKLFKVNQLESKLSRFAIKYENLVENADIIYKDDLSLREQIKLLMGNRTWYKFAIYKHIYKNHFNNECDYVINPNDYLSFYMNSLDSGSEESYLYIEDEQLRNKYRKQLKSNVINESFNPQWINFDYIDTLISLILSHKHVLKQIEEKDKHDEIKRLSLLKPSKYSYYVNQLKKNGETSSY